MKKIIIRILILLAVLLVGVVYYVNNQMGSLSSHDVRKEKYSKLDYYSSEKDEFISPKKLHHYPEQTTGGDPGFMRFLKTSDYAPKEALPKKIISKSDFSETPDKFAVYWLGHCSIILELDEKRILIDPVFENAGPLPGITPRYDVSPLERTELPQVDLVIITHDHYDHLETATIKFLADKEVKFIVPLGVGDRLENWGVSKEKITELAWNEEITHSTIKITACPGIHYSGRGKSDRNKTLWAGYVIKGQDKNIFCSGDTGYGKHLKQIGEQYGPFDMAFVEIDGWNKGWPQTHLFPDEAIKLCQDVGTNLLFPIHWGTFDLALHPWNESIQMVSDKAKENDIEMVTPILGEKVIPGITPVSKWW